MQRIRARHFAANPLCVMCEAGGHYSVATELDHKVALVNGGADDDANRQGLCYECHLRKTEQDLGHTTKPTIGADGWAIGCE